MIKYGSYLVCKNNVAEVRKFLGQFFEERKGKYNHNAWVTFVVSDDDFLINLMRGDDQPMTQNMTFEIDCDSLDELQTHAQKHGCMVQNFLATGAPQKYRYHYIEIFGPKNICKVEISYSEDISE
jgi:hypothetical protein